MTQLDDAAEELVKKMLPFSGLLDEVKERFDEMDGEIEDLQKQLDAEWDELETKANAFIARVEEERQKLEAKGDEAGQALANLTSAVETAHDELETEMDGAQAELKAFTDAVAPLDDDVEGLVATHAEGPSEGLADAAEALVREIDGAINETRRDLEATVTQGLQRVAVTVGMWADDVLKAGTEGQGRLDRAYQEWAIKMAEGADLVCEHIFEALRENVDLTVEHAAQECDKAHDEKLDDFQQVIDTVKEKLEELETVVEAAEKSIEGSGDALENGLKELRSEVLGAQKQLDKMEKFLGRFTFTQ